MDKPQRVLIAAGGTGGHLFPALYIAQALKEILPNCRIEFIGTGRPLEAEIVDKNGFTRHVIKTSGLKRRGAKGLLQFVLSFPAAALSVWKLLSSYKPDLVFGAGGYVTFLPVALSKLRRIPTWIHEAERSPGWANFVLSFIADRTSTSYPDAKMPRFAKTVYTGHPLRPEVGQATFDLRETSPKNLLIMGGSQGAQAIDAACEELAPFFARLGLKIFHQCREPNVNSLETAYREAGIDARVASFVKDVLEAYQWSDIIISRTGAGSVREIGVTRRPAILVPLPNAEEQRLNAAMLEERGQGIIVNEGPEFVSRLQAAVDKVVTEQYFRQMGSVPPDLTNVNAAHAIAEGAVQLSNNR